MDPRHRVSVMPLTELFDERGAVEGVRAADLGVDEVAALLRDGAEGVAVRIAEPLEWLAGARLFAWWKGEAKPRLIPPECASFRLEDFPDERAWQASEWRLADGRRVVVFELFH